MYLHFLGTGDAFGSGGKFHTSFFLKTNNFSALIDCGASTPIAMKRNNLSTNDIDVIFISHFHGDHYGGLPYFILEAAKVAKRKKPLTIISPPGCEDRLKKLMALLYEGSNVFEEINIKYLEFNGRDRLVNDLFLLETYPVVHMPQSLPHSLKITVEGKIVAFSGDTGFTDVLSETADKADVFVCECNFYNHNASTHLNYFKLKEIVETFNCKRFFITHLGEEMLKHEDSLEFKKATEGEKIYF